jgi:hypothetical protein
MQITKVNNSNKQTFGYNIELNKKLVSTLKKDSTKLAKEILDLNKRCNRQEETVTAQSIFRPCNEDEHYDAETEVALRMFVALKLTLANAIEDWLPNLNFARKEAIQYAKDTEKDGLVWRNELVSHLNEISQEYHPLQFN